MLKFFRKLIGVSLFVLFLAIGGKCFAWSVGISNFYPKQGDVVKVEVWNTSVKPLNFFIEDQKINFYLFKGKYVGFWGVKVNQSLGWKKLEINFADGSKETKWIKVLERKKIIKNLPLSQSTGVSSEEIAKKMTTENNLLNAISTRQIDILFTKNFGLPLIDNRKIVDGFGVLRKDGNQQTWHLGIDLDAPYGSKVFAINDGLVEYATSTVSYGNTVLINHGGGISSLYLHLSKILVVSGQRVKKGEVIGLVGSTGYSTGPHLHLSLKINGVSVDPLQFINKISF